MLKFKKEKGTRFGTTVWGICTILGTYSKVDYHQRVCSNYLKPLSDTAGKHRLLQDEMRSAKYHQNTRFRGFWKKQVMIQWPHQESMFFASTDLCWIWIIIKKKLLGSAARAAFYCCPMHMPHDDQGCKRPDQAHFQISLKSSTCFS